MGRGIVRGVLPTAVCGAALIGSVVFGLGAVGSAAQSTTAIMYFNPDSGQLENFSSDTGSSAPSLPGTIFYGFCWPPTGGETAEAGGTNEGTFTVAADGTLSGRCSRLGARGGTSNRNSTLSGTYDRAAKTVTFHMEGTSVNTLAGVVGTQTSSVVVDGSKMPVVGDRADGRVRFTYTCTSSGNVRCGITSMTGTVAAAVIFPDGPDDQSPPLPDPWVKLALVSNGCGGGPTSDEPRWGDKWEFGRYAVNFRKACDIHDAGYSGAKVTDPFNGNQKVDFYTWTKEQIDKRFYDDLVSICDNTIPAVSSGSRTECYDVALIGYSAVRTFGSKYFEERPALAGVWSNRTITVPVVWTVTQNVREVTATWKNPKGTKTYTFVGRILSLDRGHEVHGWAKQTTPAKGEWTKMTWTYVTTPVFECRVAADKDPFGCEPRLHR
jgi:hypothetical protein